jgi:hypothetical protein
LSALASDIVITSHAKMATDGHLLSHLNRCKTFVGATAKIIRVVLVSPSDVQAEWTCVGRAIEEVDRVRARPSGYRLELYHWKTDAYPGWHREGPQGLIDPVLQIDNCDILIGIFWKRIGTVTQDGTTGTEHEVLKAFKASKQHGRPRLMIYFSETPYFPKSKEETEQQSKVLDFKDRLSREQVLSWPYKGKTEFERQLRGHLFDYLNDELGKLPTPAIEISKEAHEHLDLNRVPAPTTSTIVKAGAEVRAPSKASAFAFGAQATIEGGKVRRGDLMLVTNTNLTSPGKQQVASHVGVPSVAVNGNVVFFTGNWYAALSTDGGKDFGYVDPFLMAQPSDPPESRFCCNQVVNYIESIDTFVWLLQYGPDSGDNIHRLAFAKTGEVPRGQWRVFDITARSLGVKGAYLGFPDLAVGTNFLYITTNVSDGSRSGSAVVRMPLAQIASGEPTFETFASLDYYSFRVAQNCRNTAFFAAHKDTATLIVFSWPESDSAPVSHDVAVPRWVGGNGYHSQCPDGRKWLDRADPRLTGATMAGSEVFFAWGVDSGSNQRPNPFVQVARIDSWDLTLIENISVFDAESATCYPALATNVDNDVSISYMIGGGPRFPSHVVAMLTGPRRELLVASGDRGPVPDPATGAGQWGDYLTVRPVFPDRKLFAAAAYTLKGKGNGTRFDATPHFAVFGRSEGPDSAPSL